MVYNFGARHHARISHVPEETKMSDERFPGWGLSKDEELYTLYKSNIFEPGWAGELSATQADYIQGVLTGRYRGVQGRSLKRLRE